ncbi:HGxxPAAW family protein [Streptomyces sp. NPDC012888]|uniref:HGxxPAAW family protein n=1 Tax=Streptomyces sp. NPDC012888 TaxID=3364855 RepID=UPI0036B05AE6
MSGHGYDEGHTVAGWTGTAVATAGAALTGVGVCGWAPGIWSGLGVLVLAALLTWALHLAGWGKAPGPRPVGEWGLRSRDLAARAGHEDCLGCRLAGRRRASVPDADVGAAVAPVLASGTAAADPAS